MREEPRPGDLRNPNVVRSPAPAGLGEAFPSVHEVRDLMWKGAGLVRDRASLQNAVQWLSRWSQAVTRPPRARYSELEYWRVRSLVIVGLLIARAALRREESRGGHFRTDFPSHDDVHWKTHVSDILE